MAKESVKTRDNDVPEEEDKKSMAATRTKSQEDDEKKDRERLKAEAAAMTPEQVSKLMTEKSVLKREYEDETKRRAEEHQKRIFELDIQIAKGNISTQGRTT